MGDDLDAYIDGYGSAWGADLVDEPPPPPEPPAKTERTIWYPGRYDQCAVLMRQPEWQDTMAAVYNNDVSPTRFHAGPI